MVGDDALKVLQGIDDLYVAKGRKTLHVDLKNARPPDDELLGLLLGRSGKLRAPALKTGRTLIVGFNADILTDHLA